MYARATVRTLAGLVLAAASFTANAAVVFTNLGASPPPATVGGHNVTPFSLAPQAAIPDSYDVPVLTIPGGPGGTVLTASPAVYKATLERNWGSDPWPGAYVGPIYFTGESGSFATLTLPSNTKAFYFYLQNSYDGNPVDTVTVTTNSGATSGPVLIRTDFFGANVGANGFAFHSTAGEMITSITVNTSNTNGFAVGNFGISVGPATTCASEGYTGTKLLWCQNICEKGYTGALLSAWIHRWTERYRALPYCAVE